MAWADNWGVASVDSLRLGLPCRLAMMTLGPLATRFLAEEPNDHVFKVLRAALTSRTCGEEYFMARRRLNVLWALLRDHTPYQTSTATAA